MEECNTLREDYEKCFKGWFKDKYLKGSNDDLVCSRLLKNYTHCVKSAMNERGIDVEELRQYHSKIKSKNDPAKK
ncbi:TP53-regulated inhibitor of apoptosis 1-like [Daktulosphaira vitifoliae]|uniref:TP53-regulated inhibitor of apoptosis 1-like n=1 Tax=Daktulosphaira vitifoliae TaxID=58002 RepID=UPI0021AA5190|nr:TP53-regulated inhibitor of apoptosis 1-like [Daktulosphaira vitifoliae]